MKKLIKLSDTHYIVVDDSEIKEEDWCYDVALKVFQASHNFDGYNTNLCKKITHSTQPLEGNCTENVCWDCHGKITDKGVCFCNNEVKNISLSEVEEVIHGYSVEKEFENRGFPLTDTVELGFDEIKNKEFFRRSLKNVWFNGFNTHKELVKDKLFTVEKVIQILEEENYGQGSVNRDEYKARVISKLQLLLTTTEWECCISDGKLVLL